MGRAQQHRGGGEDELSVLAASGRFGAQQGRPLDAARQELNAAAARLVEDGLAAWSGGAERERALIVRGRANLLQDSETVEDLERVRAQLSNPPA